jgi:DNA-binding transcriptional LysR family regulator
VPYREPDPSGAEAVLCSEVVLRARIVDHRFAARPSVRTQGHLDEPAAAKLVLAPESLRFTSIGDDGEPGRRAANEGTTADGVGSELRGEAARDLSGEGGPDVSILGVSPCAWQVEFACGQSMDTRLLETFLEVSRCGSVTVAGGRLGYTQSGVSRQIAQLEASIGASLFDRRPRGVSLTEHGKELVSHAERILASLEAARSGLESLGRLEGGRLRVGAFPTAIAALVPRAVAEFRVQHPDIDLSLVEGLAPAQLSRLVDGTVDVAIITTVAGEVLDEKRFEFVHLLDDELLIAVPKDHRLASAGSVCIRDLAEESWVGAAPTDADGVLGPGQIGVPFAPRVDYVVREWTAKLGLVAQGLGITPLSSLSAPALRDDIVVLKLGRRDQRRRPILAATLRGTTPSPAVHAFLRIIMAKAQELLVGEPPAHEPRAARASRRARPPRAPREVRRP